MRSNRSYIVGLITIGILPAVLGVPINSAQTVAQSSESVTLPLFEGRPLAAAATKLTEIYGIPVSYEDAKWADSNDLMPIGRVPANQGKALRNPDSPSPSIASLQLRYDRDPKSRNPLTPIEAVLNDVVNDHTGRRNPGEFRLLKLPDDRGFALSPSRSKNSRGTLSAALPPLDVRISFPAEERTDDELLATIVRAINSGSGENVILFFNKGNARPVTAKMSANNEPAREVLSRAFQELYPGKLVWHLYYDAGENWWALNILPVYKQFVTATGETRSSPVYWPPK
jgi:hypothetical protein